MKQYTFIVKNKNANKRKVKPSHTAEGMSPEPASKAYEESIEEGGKEPHCFEVSSKPKSIVKPRKRLCLEEKESEDWSKDSSSQVEEQRSRIRTPNGAIDPAANSAYPRPQRPEAPRGDNHEEELANP